MNTNAHCLWIKRLKYCLGLSLIIISGLSLTCFIRSAEAQVKPVSASDYDDVLSLKAPIKKVTLYQGHAVVRREAKVRITPKGSLLKFPDLPRHASDIKVYAKGSELQRISTQNKTRTKLDYQQFEKHLKKIEQVNQKALVLNTEFESKKEHLNDLFQLASRQAKNIKQPILLNKKTQKTWQQFHIFIEKQQAQFQNELIEIEESLDSLFVQYQNEWKAIRAIIEAAQERQVIEVFALLKQKTAQLSNVQLSYQVPNVSWTPSYEIHVDTSRGKAQRNFAVKVSQSSGEDWNNVALEVSTGRNQSVSTRPTLQTWLLSEEKQFIPSVQAASLPHRPPLFSRPVIQGRTKRGQTWLNRLNERFIRSRQDAYKVSTKHPALAQILNQNRVNQLVFSKDASALNNALFDGLSMGSLAGLGEISSNLSKGGLSSTMNMQSRPRRRAHRSKKHYQASSPPPRPARARNSRVSVPTAMSFESDDFAAESAPNSKLSTSSSLIGARGLIFADLTQYIIQEPVYIHRYIAPNRSSIPNQSSAISIPMQVTSLSIDLIYESTPALSKHVYLSGQAIHKGQHAIMSGMASIFSNGAFVGESRLKQILPGEKLSIALGADLDVEVKRHLEIKTTTSGVFSKTETNHYEVSIQVANYKKRKIQIRLFDVLPISDHDKVKVKLINSSPKAEIKDSNQGIVQWDLALKAGEKRKLSLKYEITNPAEWRVYQK